MKRILIYSLISLVKLTLVKNNLALLNQVKEKLSPEPLVKVPNYFVPTRMSQLLL